MDPFSDQYMRMNRRITNASNKLFPFANQVKYREIWENQCLEKWLNNLSINLQDYDRKERVSFYDDDMTFYFTLSLPVSDMADFDDSVMDLVDVFGGLFGITMASSKNGWF